MVPIGFTPRKCDFVHQNCDWSTFSDKSGQISVLMTFLHFSPQHSALAYIIPEFHPNLPEITLFHLNCKHFAGKSSKEPKKGLLATSPPYHTPHIHTWLIYPPNGTNSSQIMLRIVTWLGFSAQICLQKEKLHSWYPRSMPHMEGRVTHTSPYIHTEPRIPAYFARTHISDDEFIRI